MYSLTLYVILRTGIQRIFTRHRSNKPRSNSKMQESCCLVQLVCATLVHASCPSERPLLLSPCCSPPVAPLHSMHITETWRRRRAGVDAKFKRAKPQTGPPAMRHRIALLQRGPYYHHYLARAVRAVSGRVIKSYRMDYFLNINVDIAGCRVEILPRSRSKLRILK